MSDKYEISGVTLEATGGGWYELTHPSLSEPDKVQGKENAEARAAEIAQAATSGDANASIPPQPPLEAAQADLEKDAKIAELEKQLEAQKEQLAQVRTVHAEEQAELSSRVPTAVPRSFNGEMDSKTKASLKAMGVGTTKIVLEENESIPPTGLYLGHNCRGYVIKPGEPVDVPDFLLNVLDDAVTSTPMTDSRTQKVLGYRDRMKYPYRRV